MAGPTAARESPVGPYEVAPAAVCRLVPTAAVLDSDSATAPNGTSLPTVGAVQDWIEQVSAIVQVTLGDSSRISDGTRTGIIQSAAQTVVALGAGSYLAAAAFPARGGANSGSLADILWSRYEDALAKLLAMVTLWISDGGGDVDPEPGGAGAAAVFPPPRFPDCMVF